MNIFKSFKLYLPSVIELKIFYSKLYEYTGNLNESIQIQGNGSGHNQVQDVFNKTKEIVFPSFPNLKKITLINNVTDPDRETHHYYVHPVIDISTLINQLKCNKKINHIILKGMKINQASLENDKLEALKKNIKLEIS